jgi:DNA-binding response OmpR family regulator
MIKKLRKFTNMTVLMITEDNIMQTALSTKFNDAKELIFLNNIEDITSCKSTFDIMILDFNINNAVDILRDMNIFKPLLPKIIILDNGDEKDVVNCINYGAYSILNKPSDYTDLRYSMMMALNQSKRVDKININNGIYYDSYRERFYDKSGAIPFTNFEFDLLKLLLDNHDKIISYDEIKNKVWKDKKMSIYTMRNVINKIRKKTYYEIIKNNSSAGYKIDTLK